ncbi:MAG: ion transporter [Pirellulales bacterium]
MTSPPTQPAQADRGRIGQSPHFPLQAAEPPQGASQATLASRGSGLRRRVHALLETPHEQGLLGRLVAGGLVVLIVANVAAFVLETVQPIRRAAPAFFLWFEVVSVIIFSAEYLLRLWSCTASPRYPSPIKGRLRFAVTPMALIDLAAILPFYLPFVIADLRVLRAIRMLRLLRLTKLGRYSLAVQTIGRVLVAKRAELAVILGGILVVLLFASSLVYLPSTKHNRKSSPASRPRCGGE